MQLRRWRGTHRPRPCREARRGGPLHNALWRNGPPLQLHRQRHLDPRPLRRPASPLPADSLGLLRRAAAASGHRDGRPRRNVTPDLDSVARALQARPVTPHAGTKHVSRLMFPEPIRARRTQKVDGRQLEKASGFARGETAGSGEDIPCPKSPAFRKGRCAARLSGQATRPAPPFVTVEDLKRMARSGVAEVIINRGGLHH